MWRRICLAMCAVLLLLWTGECTYAEMARYVQLNYTGENGSATQRFDMVDNPLKVYTEFGIMEYALSSLHSVRRDAGSDSCVIETVHGDHLIGKLITQSLMYYYFDTEKWLNISEDRPFAMDMIGVTPEFDQRMFARITLSDGSILYIDPGTQTINIAVDGISHEIPISALADVRFSEKQVGDERKVIEALVTYAHGVCVTGEVCAGKSSYAFKDSFGSRAECSVDELTRFEGIQRMLKANEKQNSDSWMEMSLEMTDGRCVTGRMPFAVIRVTRPEGSYILTTPMLSVIRIEDNREVSIETVDGDCIRGNMEQTALSVIPEENDATNTVNVKLRSLKRIRFIGGTNRSQDDTLFVESDGSRINGMPQTGNIQMTEKGTRTGTILKGSEIKKMVLQQQGWSVTPSAEGVLYEPVEKTLSWLALCDGQIHEVRWKNIHGIGRSGVDMDVVETERIHADNAENKSAEEEGGSNIRESFDTESIPGKEVSRPRMKAGHVLQICVLINGEKEIDEPARRISSSGDLTLPLLGRVPVAGLTLDELSDRLTDRYREYYRDPQLAVQYVMDEQSEAASPWGYVTVLGKVKHPGKINIPPTQDLTVSAAIQAAGGFDTSAKETGIRVTRPGGTEAPAQQFDINLRNVGSRGESQNDMELESGDIVYVPEMMF